MSSYCMTVSMPQHMFLTAAEVSLICILWGPSIQAARWHGSAHRSCYLLQSLSMQDRAGRLTAHRQSSRRCGQHATCIPALLSQARTLFIGIHSPHTNSTARQAHHASTTEPQERLHLPASLRRTHTPRRTVHYIRLQFLDRQHDRTAGPRIDGMLAGKLQHRCAGAAAAVCRRWS